MVYSDTDYQIQKILKQSLKKKPKNYLLQQIKLKIMQSTYPSIKTISENPCIYSTNDHYSEHPKLFVPSSIMTHNMTTVTVNVITKNPDRIIKPQQ